jgi:hypothetical protein
VLAKEIDAPSPPRRMVISVLGITQILAWGSSYYLLAVLAKPISMDTGWPLSWIVGAMSIGLLVSGMVSPRVGRVIEHRGGRPVLAIGAIFLAMGLVGLAAAPTVPVFVLAWVILGVGMGAGLYDPAFATLGRLYGTNARSAITALTLFGGFASTVCWPLSAYMVDAVGWRGACVAYALIQLLVSLPLYLFGLPRELRHVPSPPANSESGTTSEQPREQTDTRRVLFVLLALSLTMASVISSALSVHLLTILQARGIALGTAVALGAMVGPSQVGARIIEMLLGRRFHPIWTMVASSTLLAAGLALLFAGFPAVAVGLVIYGAGNGLTSIVRGTLPLALFGADGYASLMGRLARPLLVAQAVAPSLGAVILDQYGGIPTIAALVTVAAANIATVLWLAFVIRSVANAGALVTSRS